MNRYPLWKYILLLAAVLLGLLYTLPNFYGEAPAVQVSAAKSSVKIDAATQQRVESALKDNGITSAEVSLDVATQSLYARFSKGDIDTQMHAQTVIENAIAPRSEDSPDYIVALNMMPLTPRWLQAMGAKPMYLGLDLRGGVHFLMQVDTDAALTKRAEALAGNLRLLLRDANIRHGGVARENTAVVVRVRSAEMAQQVHKLIGDQYPDLSVSEQAEDNGALRMDFTLKPEAAQRIQEQALEQNRVTLSNRVNELGVAEPVIQKQGLDRIVVQLPGVQDTSRAKDIIGRTATLELRLVDESAEGRAAERGQGMVPMGSERFFDANGVATIVYREVVLTGDNLTDAQPGFDSQTGRPTVNLNLDSAGAKIFRDVTRQNIKKRMAIILFEKGQGLVVTAPVIQSEIPGGRVQITGNMSTKEAGDTSLLLRSGSLAAPMQIIEERTVGPSLGQENIERGVHSVVWGFLIITAFMCIYYGLFGVISAISLAVNVLLLMALLSIMQATLTLPGIAAMALAIGVAIDSNVLINERIREELRADVPAQNAIFAGYKHAWATILDSNVTTLIAGLALLAFGSGPVRGFAVVHCLGILTSMFSAVFCSRGLVNLIYGRRKKLKSISIGQIWKPEEGLERSVAGAGLSMDDKE